MLAALGLRSQQRAEAWAQRDSTSGLSLPAAVGRARPRSAVFGRVRIGTTDQSLVVGYGQVEQGTFASFLLRARIPDRASREPDRVGALCECSVAHSGLSAERSNIPNDRVYYFVRATSKKSFPVDQYPAGRACARRQRRQAHPCPVSRCRAGSRAIPPRRDGTHCGHLWRG